MSNIFLSFQNHPIYSTSMSPYTQLTFLTCRAPLPAVPTQHKSDNTFPNHSFIQPLTYCTHSLQQAGKMQGPDSLNITLQFVTINICIPEGKKSNQNGLHLPPPYTAQYNRSLVWWFLGSSGRDLGLTGMAAPHNLNSWGRMIHLAP